MVSVVISPWGIFHGRASGVHLVNSSTSCMSFRAWLVHLVLQFMVLLLELIVNFGWWLEHAGGNRTAVQYREGPITSHPDPFSSSLNGFPLVFSPLSTPSYTPRWILLKSCFYLTPNSVEAPLASRVKSIPFSQIPLPTARFPVIFRPSLHNSLSRSCTCRGSLSAVLCTLCIVSFLWLLAFDSVSAHPNPTHPAFKFQQFFLFLAAFTVLIIDSLWLWLVVYTSCSPPFTPICKFLQSAACVSKEWSTANFVALYVTGALRLWSMVIEWDAIG